MVYLGKGIDEKKLEEEKKKDIESKLPPKEDSDFEDELPTPS